MATAKTISPFAVCGPSVFTRDKAFRVTATGLSASQVASRGVQTRIRQSGSSPGTIPGLSKKADIQRKPVREAQAMLRGRR